MVKLSLQPNLTYMKYFVLTLLFILASCKKNSFEKATITPSKTDSISTDEQIKNYMSTIDTNFKYFNPQNIQYVKSTNSPTIDSIMKITAKGLNINKSVYKADFDNNGYTDLLVLGGWGETNHYSSYVVMNFGRKKKPKLIALNKDMQLLDIPKVLSIRNEPFLILYSSRNMRGTNPKISDTTSTKLIFKYGGFAEYSEKPSENHIEKIEFKTSPCFGTCPVYQLTINKNKSATFLAEHYNFNKDKRNNAFKNEGLFDTKINDIDYKQLVNLLNYIDFKNLKDEYSVSWTDDQTATLTITYDNGKTKTIEDYGMIGTYGLSSVYDLLAEMRFNQKWKKIKEH
ncbi:hypothetical protein D3C87_349330 [compost metagenome]